MSEKVKTAGLIFDMDGCLVDTEAVYKIAWRKAFEKFAVEISTEQIDSWVGIGRDVIGEQINQITKNEVLTEEIRNAREDIFFQMLSEGLVRLLPGAIEILEFAKEKQLVIGLASSTFKEKGMRILAHFELTDYFNFIVFGDEVGNRKPAGDIYLKAVKESGLSKEQLLVFEDSIIGCEAAHAADLQTIWIPDNFSEGMREKSPETVCGIVPTLKDGKLILQKRL